MGSEERRALAGEFSIIEIDTFDDECNYTNTVEAERLAEERRREGDLK